MAIKHRKLFPETNQSASCLDFCDSTCPYDCYVYAEPWIPPPPPSASPPPETIYTPDQDDSPTISPYLIITVGLLAGFFLLVSSYAIIVKYGSVWRRRSHPPHSESDDQEFLDENRGPEIDHPIWYIATVGLQQAIINSITVCRYKRGEGLIEGTECSVCLSEFREDETLRLLPKCNHAFHIPCIDTWLRSHTNCPLCRARIVPVSVAVDIVNTPPAEPTGRSSRRLGPTQQTQMEINSGHDDTESDSNGGSNQQQSTGAGGELQILDGDGRASKEGVNINGDSGDDRVVDDSDRIKPVRRSVSVNSSSSSSSAGSDELGGNWVHRRMDGVKLRSSSKSIAQCLHKTPVSMKRSFSCGGRFFFPRHNRSTNSIILP